MTHLERNDPLTDFAFASADDTSFSNARVSTQPSINTCDTSPARSTSPIADPSMQQMFGFFSEFLKQQSELMQQVTN